MTRYLLVLLLLSHLAAFLWRRNARVNDCDSPRCIARDHEYLGLVEELGRLRREASLLCRQNVFLAEAARKHRARAEFFAARNGGRSRGLSTEARVSEEHVFTDPISGREVTLVFGPEPLRPYDGSHGVRHSGCEALADVSPDLDAWFCRSCQAHGRISGAWFMDLWTQRAEA